MVCCRAAALLAQGAKEYGRRVARERPTARAELAAALAVAASRALERSAQQLLAVFRVVRARNCRDAMALAVVLPVALRPRPAQRVAQHPFDPGLQKARCRALVLPGREAVCVQRVEAL